MSSTIRDQPARGIGSIAHLFLSRGSRAPDRPEGSFSAAGRSPGANQGRDGPGAAEVLAGHLPGAAALEASWRRYIARTTRRVEFPGGSIASEGITPVEPEPPSVVVLCTDVPADIVATYRTIKGLVRSGRAAGQVWLGVVRAVDTAAAEQVFNKLSRVCGEFLGLDVGWAGFAGAADGSAGQRTGGNLTSAENGAQCSGR